MDWIIENWGMALVVVTIAIVIGLFLSRRYKSRGDLVHDDLSSVLADALEYLKGVTGDRMAEVTQSEVHDVADKFYARLVAGTALEQFITKEHMRATLWSLFTEWRDWFIAMKASIIEGGASHGRG